ncbi:hypothetical protein PMG11_06240 [Penicillium brasilianum]|uniref:Secreted protein n=1 Tax=Penicillium brasilianum TaxID=104259 RepID=A0A0F7TQ51_PENBI|nr:hypothetical protein PMG11_06240 [Penicillium brasilianum]
MVMKTHTLLLGLSPVLNLAGSDQALQSVHDIRPAVSHSLDVFPTTLLRYPCSPLGAQAPESATGLIHHRPSPFAWPPVASVSRAVPSPHSPSVSTALLIFKVQRDRLDSYPPGHIRSGLSPVFSRVVLYQSARPSFRSALGLIYYNRPALFWVFVVHPLRGRSPRAPKWPCALLGLILQRKKISPNPPPPPVRAS